MIKIRIKLDIQTVIDTLLLKILSDAKLFKIIVKIENL